MHHHSHDEQSHAAKCEACLFSSLLNQAAVECSNNFSPVLNSEFSIEVISSPLNSSYNKNNLNSRAPPSV